MTAEGIWDFLENHVCISWFDFMIVEGTWDFLKNYVCISSLEH